MKHLLATAAATALVATSAGAGGVDRSGQNIGVIFEPGNYVEFSFASIDPDVSGVGAGTAVTNPTPTPGAPSGDMTNDFGLFGTAFKLEVNENVDVAFIFDQPFGADVTYPLGTGYFAQGSVASMTTTAMTGIVRYRMPNNFSLHGGVRYQNMKASAIIPFVTAFPGVTPPYTVNGLNDPAVGYLVGAAYERPEIALRVALTYNSAIEHNLPTTETSFLGSAVSSTTIETPQSINLDFQTGVAKDTLVFGSVRWVEWSKFVISPTVYVGIAGEPLVSFDDDTISYTLGVGRRLNDTWAGAITVGYEAPTGGFSSNLAPTDGNTSIGLAATYTMGNMELTTGVRYLWVGDAMTEILSSGVAASEFTDNTAVSFGMKVGFTF